MSKRNKKGRRHRTVNRTPRPVTAGAARGGGDTRAQDRTRSQTQRLPSQQSGTAEPASASVAMAAASAATVPAGARTAATGGGGAVEDAGSGSGSGSDSWKETGTARSVPVQQQESPQVPTPADRPDHAAGDAGSGEQADMAQIFGPVRDGGLGRGAAQTWHRLQDCGADGAGLEELCSVAGFQESTVAKHLSGLADHALARLHDDRWYAVGGTS